MAKTLRTTAKTTLTTAKNKKNSKIACLKKILKHIRERGTASSSELNKVLFGSKTDRSTLRSVQNYLFELVELGLLMKGDCSDQYLLAENRQVFETKNDLELALNHSKRLLKKDHYLDKIKRENLFSHFKTGYTKEIWQPFNEYMKLIKANNVTKSLLPKFGFLPLVKSNILEDLVMKPMPKPKGGPYLARVKYDFEQREVESPKEPNKHVSPEVMAKLVNLQENILEKLLRMEDTLQDGVPIKGTCEACPIKHITVKDDLISKKGSS